MLTILGVVLLFLILIPLAAFAYAQTRPDAFRIERTAEIEAHPDAIFPLLDDFRRWAEWSPWEGKDPAMKRTYVGAPAGEGAVYAWRGNRAVGAGRMEIVETSPPLRLLIDLHFLKPFEARNKAEFTLEPAGSAAARKPCRDPRHLGDAWPRPSHDEDDGARREHGPHGWPRFRDRPRQSEARQREPRPAAVERASCPALGRASTKAKARRDHRVVDGRAEPGMTGPNALHLSPGHVRRSADTA